MRKTRLRLRWRLSQEFLHLSRKLDPNLRLLEQVPKAEGTLVDEGVIGPVDGGIQIAGDCFPLFRIADLVSGPLHASEQNQPPSILVAIRTMLAAVGRFLDQPIRQRVCGSEP